MYGKQSIKVLCYLILRIYTRQKANISPRMRFSYLKNPFDIIKMKLSYEQFENITNFIGGFCVCTNNFIFDISSHFADKKQLVINKTTFLIYLRKSVKLVFDL